MLPSPEGVSCSWPEVSVMMMLVVLSAVAVAEELAEEEVDELVMELERELDFVDDTAELTEALIEAEELNELVENVVEAAEDTEVDEAERVEDRLLKTDDEEDDTEEVELEAALALTETTFLFFIDPLTKYAESTMYERSVVLLTALLDCALLR